MTTPAMPPPTTHSLPHSQRLRLMRSTRKLEAVLGETPLFLEPTASSSSHTHAHTTLGRSNTTVDATTRDRLLPIRSSSFRHSPSTSVASMSVASSRPDNHLHARPTLVLRLPTATARPASFMSVSAYPVSPSTDHLPSPLSPSFGFSANSPTVSTFEPNAVDPSRRRKVMAKLVRTLGENVPPELVFPPSSSSSSSASASRSASVKGRRRASTLSVQSAESEHTGWDSLRPPVPMTRASSRASSHSHSSGYSVSSSLSSHAQEHDPLLAGFPAPPSHSHSHSPSHSSSSHHTTHAIAHSQPTTHEYLLPLPHASTSSSMRRQEQGWSGEWAGDVTDMDDVVRKLRGLK